MNGTTRGRTFATFLGILAVIFWGSTMAFTRSLSETVGTVTSASYVYLLAGGMSCAFVLAGPGALRKLKALPLTYWAGCGSLFVLYMVALYLAVGLACGRQQVLEVALVNYLWPSLTLLLSLPLLARRARWTLWPGILLACAGVVLATLQRGPVSPHAFLENVCGNAWPYALALVAAVSWGFYSNLSRRWAGSAEGNGVPVFLLATGLVLTAMRGLFNEEPRWTPRAAVELVYMAVFPTMLAYVFWDTAMRRGRLILVASLSYFAPLLSTAVSCAYLRVLPGPKLWVACALVTAGAVICNRSITPTGPGPSPR